MLPISPRLVAVAASLIGLSGANSEAAAEDRSRVEAFPYTHARFERLAPSTRARMIDDLAGQRWGRACPNAQMKPSAVGPKAASWHIACGGSGLMDYILLLPTQESEKGARLIYCGPSTVGGRACALN